MATKKLLAVSKPQAQHWVGDGFAVTTVFAISPRSADLLSPFVMMDYAAPRYFAPTTDRRGVGEHPHRGFETVTFAYRGSIEHRDSGGGGGRIGPGDVQWMTAGSGVVHEEMHGQDLRENGGELEMVQLWVNLPRAHKMTAPRYQALSDTSFPRLALSGAQGETRLIAGVLGNSQGPAQTMSPIVILDFLAREDSELIVPLPRGMNALAFARRGKFRAGEQTLDAGSLALFSQEQESLALSCSKDAAVLILAGTPLHEPVVQKGPFVMNSEEEILQAFRDYQDGKMGHLAV